MKLHLSPTSPFARKIRVQILESGLEGEVEEVVVPPMTPSPVKPLEELSAQNPLGKIPVLILDDGRAIFDSPVIAEYLDAEHGGGRLLPASGPERWATLRLVAIGDGIADAAVLMRYEEALRPEAHRWEEWSAGQADKIRRSLALLDRELPATPGEPTLGTIAVAIAFGYLDLRQPGLGWRDSFPNCATWYESYRQRPAMLATAPPT